MALVKEHHGVKIYVSTEGEFYCDAINNSDKYINKTFVSAKLISIEKAIDSFNGPPIEGPSYYFIDVYSFRIQLLKVIKHIGKRLFFNDNTDTNSYSRRALYPKNVDETIEFSEITKLFEKLSENQAAIYELNKIQNNLRKEAALKLEKLKKVKLF